MCKVDSSKSQICWLMPTSSAKIKSTLISEIKFLLSLQFPDNFLIPSPSTLFQLVLEETVSQFMDIPEMLQNSTVVEPKKKKIEEERRNWSSHLGPNSFYLFFILYITFSIPYTTPLRPGFFSIILPQLLSPSKQRPTPGKLFLATIFQILENCSAQWRFSKVRTKLFPFFFSPSFKGEGWRWGKKKSAVTCVAN